MNCASFAGRIGRDALLRTTPSGAQVVGWSLAVDERKGTEKTTLWIDCSFWGERATKVMQYLTVGTVVAVHGQVGLRAYAGKDGAAKAALTLRVENLTLLGGGQQRQGDASHPASSDRSAPAASSMQAPAFVDDDIPF